MKVRELIKELMDYPMDWDVSVKTYDNDFDIDNDGDVKEIEEVGEVHAGKEKYVQLAASLPELKVKDKRKKRIKQKDTDDYGRPQSPYDLSDVARMMRRK